MGNKFSENLKQVQIEQVQIKQKTLAIADKRLGI